MADPTARNEVCAHHALEVAFNRPTTLASRLTCPLLMQVGTDDDVVPATAARRAAKNAGHWAQLREYPFDCFGGYRARRARQQLRRTAAPTPRESNTHRVDGLGPESVIPSSLNRVW